MCLSDRVGSEHVGSIFIFGYLGNRTYQFRLHWKIKPSDASASLNLYFLFYPLLRNEIFLRYAPRGSLKSRRSGTNPSFNRSRRTARPLIKRYSASPARCIPLGFWVFSEDKRWNQFYRVFLANNRSGVDSCCLFGNTQPWGTREEGEFEKEREVGGTEVELSFFEIDRISLNSLPGSNNLWTRAPCTERGATVKSTKVYNCTARRFLYVLSSATRRDTRWSRAAPPRVFP